MTTPALMWPASLAIDNVSFELENVSRGGGLSISGDEQVVVSPAARWTAKFDVWLGSRAEVGCYRAIRSSRSGRANPWLLSPCETEMSPASLAGLPNMATATFGDGTTFSDGAKFEADGTYAFLSFLSNALDSAIALHCDPPPAAGTFFSLIDPAADIYDLHVVTKLLEGPIGSPFSSGFSTGFGPLPQFVVEVQPPVRRRWPAGYPVTFGRPLCRMRLMSDAAGALTRERQKETKPSLSFVEMFNRSAVSSTGLYLTTQNPLADRLDFSRTDDSQYLPGV